MFVLHKSVMSNTPFLQHSVFLWGVLMAEKFHSPLIEACFKNRFFFLLVSILSFLILSPLLRGFVGIKILLDLFLTAVFISAIYAVSQKKYFSLIGILLALPMLAVTWSAYFVKIAVMPLAGSCFGILFFAFMVITILLFVFEQREITLDVISGAIVVYLLIAIMWAFIFRFMETLHPGSFAIPQGLGEETRPLFIYYSFVTITTLGYGDITPLTDVARSFSILEAVVGQIYLVVLIARLVGTHIAQSMNRNSR